MKRGAVLTSTHYWILVGTLTLLLAALGIAAMPLWSH